VIIFNKFTKITGNLSVSFFLSIPDKCFVYLYFIQHDRNNGSPHQVKETGNEKIYFQVCMTLKEEKTIQREYRPLEAIDDHFPKYVLSLDKGFETSLKGVQWMNIRDFLLQE